MSAATAVVRQRNSPSSPATRYDDDDVSVALASDVGSVMGRPKDAHLRSITFFKRPQQTETEWSMQCQDASPRSSSTSGGLFRGSTTSTTNNKGVIVSRIGGVIAQHSWIQPGDYVRLINGQTIGPSYDAQQVEQLLQDSWEREGYLSIQVGNL